MSMGGMRPLLELRMPPALPYRIPEGMSIATLNLRNGGFGKALAAYWLIIGGSLQELLLQQTRLVLKRCVDYTPPFSVGRLSKMLGKKWGSNAKEAFKAAELSSSAYAIGRRRVATDIQRIFTPVRSLRIYDKSKKLQKAVEKKDKEVIKLILGPKWASIEILDHVDPAVHQMQRNRRGNVRRKPIQKLVLGKASVQNYVAKRSKLVGFAKSGWKTACLRFGHPLPKWVSRHNGPGFGIDESGSEVCRTVIGNRVSYMQRKGRELRIIELAVDGQAKAMASNVRRILRQHNKL
jgi:hypothetical protein